MEKQVFKDVIQEACFNKTLHFVAILVCVFQFVNPNDTHIQPLRHRHSITTLYQQQQEQGQLAFSEHNLHSAEDLHRQIIGE